VDSAGSAYVAGLTASTNFPIFNPFQGTKDVARTPSLRSLAIRHRPVCSSAAANYNVLEDCTFVTITLNRFGDLTGETTVDF